VPGSAVDDPDGATQALGDAERAAISREVFPDHGRDGGAR
jgi:hypothetical protein